MVSLLLRIVERGKKNYWKNQQMLKESASKEAFIISHVCIYNINICKWYFEHISMFAKRKTKIKIGIFCCDTKSFEQFYFVYGKKFIFNAFSIFIKCILFYDGAFSSSFHPFRKTIQKKKHGWIVSKMLENKIPTTIEHFESIFQILRSWDLTVSRYFSSIEKKVLDN